MTQREYPSLLESIYNSWKSNNDYIKVICNPYWALDGDTLTQLLEEYEVLREELKKLRIRYDL